MGIRKMTSSCRCCGSKKIKFLFRRQLMTYEVSYNECQDCEYVQTEAPFWLKEAYSHPINETDIGLLKRNNGNVKLVLSTLIAMGIKNEPVIDMSGGYGILVRLLRDAGVDAKWHDPYCENIFALGHEAIESERYGLVTCFEAFEHLQDPCDYFSKLLKRSENILISTELIDSEAPSDWYYYGADHGQHIGFFRLATLKFIAKKFNRSLITDGRSVHLFTEQKVSRIIWRALIKVGSINPKILSRTIKGKINDEADVFGRAKM